MNQVCQCFCCWPCEESIKAPIFCQDKYLLIIINYYQYALKHTVLQVLEGMAVALEEERNGGRNQERKGTIMLEDTGFFTLFCEIHHFEPRKPNESFRPGFRRKNVEKEVSRVAQLEWSSTPISFLFEVPVVTQRPSGEYSTVGLSSSPLSTVSRIAPTSPSARITS